MIDNITNHSNTHLSYKPQTSKHRNDDRNRYKYRLQLETKIYR
ncbi:hypothetical protein BAZSYMA_ACONTIG81303_1 [Bathymodiolus azoricus thioautotrophic gill symbiont]|uniref:Uncharacterized protein n=1 Tax=Bathymodiolus azoricus thioautotrophic gill symbiont TaxID=235205 RepID=A0A1H6LUY3_9GAMM|nr:hypothetical protein BAZSYMA_ACONTIG81303_1 [Bathymodiolus azoricus thioautotrophic gill symbiont]